MGTPLALVSAVMALRKAREPGLAWAGLGLALGSIALLFV